MDLDEEKIKNSFLKVKEDIETLKTQINELKSLIKGLEYSLNFSKKTEEPYTKSPVVPQETSSTGNQGVYADIHSFIHSFNKHSLNTQPIQEEETTEINQNIPKNTLTFQKIPISWDFSNLKQVDSLFLTLTKQEFFTFMIIYQLEEDLKRGISYLEVSRNMSLSEGCIRTYVSQMLKKGAPLQKIRLNNKLTLLSIDKEFRSLNLKSRLTHLLAKSDPTQTTLF